VRGGRLFGSVTKSDIARGIEDHLEERIDRHDRLLDDPIRVLGTRQVEVKLHEHVNALVTVESSRMKRSKTAASAVRRDLLQQEGL
jgi:ribosomal protein L9